MTTGLRGRAAAGHPVDVASGTLFNVWDDFAVSGEPGPLASTGDAGSSLLATVVSTAGSIVRITPPADGYDSIGTRGSRPR